MRISILLVLLSSFLSYGQSKLYRGDRPNQNDLIYLVSDRKITRMTSSLWGKDVLFIRNNEVSDDSFGTSVRYTLDGNKVYNGQSHSPFDLLYEFEKDKLYQVINSSLRKCLYTFSNNQIFVGDSTSPFDCLFTVEIENNDDNALIFLFLAILPY